MDRVHQWVCNSNAGWSQQIESRADECILPTHGMRRPPRWKRRTSPSRNKPNWWRHIRIIGSDFNAERELGVGAEHLRVGPYTLNESNKRGDWMTQLLMIRNFAALNTMYKKMPDKQTTYRSSNGKTNLYAKWKHDEDEGIHDEETTNSNKELDVSEDHTKMSKHLEEVNEDENRETRSEHFPEFTKRELQAVIHCLKKRKLGDTMRIKAEDIKESDDETKEIVRENFERSHQTGKHGPRSVEKSVDKSFFQKKWRCG